MPRLSRPQVVWLSRILGSAAYAVDWRGRPVALENLRVAFAREHITQDQCRRIARASYQTFARTFMDLFWSMRLTKENCAQHVRIRYEDAGTEALARQKGSLWVTPHFGNFELVSLAMGFRGFVITVVAQDFKNRELTEIFKQLRQSSGHRIIPQAGAMLRLVKELKRGGHAALLTDLNIPPNKTAAAIDCFGLKTCVTTLHTHLAARLDLPVIASVCLPNDDGSYDVTKSAPFLAKDHASPAAMAQAVWDWFEQHIRRTPEAWLWMYKHWRYLPGLENDGSYPDYANPHRGFRDMLDAGPQK